MPDPRAPLLDTPGCRVQFPGVATPSLTLPALRIDPGERVLISGATGSGKTTLWLLLTGLLRPEVVAPADQVHLLGDSLPITNPAAIGRHLGAVFQQPAQQLLATTCYEEIALGLRALRWEEARIANQTDTLLSRVNLGSFHDKSPVLLSGGQQQRLALAAALAREPDWLLLDEPFAQLDPRGARELAGLLRNLTQERRIGLILTEHRHEVALRCVDRIVHLEEGEVVADGPVTEVTPRLISASLPPPRGPLEPTSEPVELRGVATRYSPQEPIALQGDLTLPAAGVTVLLGTNGSGKSTLLSLLAGEIPLRVGTLRWPGGRRPRITYVPQQSDLRLLGATIAEDLALTGQAPQNIATWAQEFALPDLGIPPLTASRGERLQIVLAAAVLENPDWLLLDEPTAGQDAAALRRFVDILHMQRIPIILATHDLALARAVATHVIILKAGQCLAAGAPDLLEDARLLRRADLLEDRDE